jgi:hypothetical protein
MPEVEENDARLKVVEAITQLPQTQKSLNYQFCILLSAANRLGLYDAADVIQSLLNKK